MDTIPREGRVVGTPNIDTSPWRGRCAALVIVAAAINDPPDFDDPIATIGPGR
jgi:hypothetical protein